MTDKINSYYLDTDPKPADKPDEKLIPISADAYAIKEVLERICNILSRK